MIFSTENIPYKKTNAFSKIVLDYLDDAEPLRDFYHFRPDIDGIKEAIKERTNFPVNRQLLVDTLQDQYADKNVSETLKGNIDWLRSENTFTVCTAHQPNIFTGHLYFIYKILHAIKLCEELKAALPENNFVPVYYMGSEDADLEELGEIQINGKQYRWETEQTGAVGRMKIDTVFLQLIDELEGRLAVEKFGPEVMAFIREDYAVNTTVETATFNFVHRLFNEFGLVILLPDNRALKNEFAQVIRRELESNFSHAAVTKTVLAFPKEYRVQAAGRDINLFYLQDNIRERIEKSTEGFSVSNSNLHFTEAELLAEIKSNPEKFSPNVILRPVFQEMMLPDVAFIGGGGELAYWLELKNVFAQANVFFPVLVLRNSFAVIDKNTSEKIASLGLKNSDIFRSENDLLSSVVQVKSAIRLDLEVEKRAIDEVFKKIQHVSESVDGTLGPHVRSLNKQAINRLSMLEKKMLKAEKKKFEAQQRQIRKVKSTMYPGGTLQERVDNILPLYAVYGKDILKDILNSSGGLQQEFTLLHEQQTL